MATTPSHVAHPRSSLQLPYLVATLIAGLLFALVAAAPVEAQDTQGTRTTGPRPHGWHGALGLGLAGNLSGSDGDSDQMGLGTHILLTRGVAVGVRMGLLADAAWFDSPWRTDRRIQVAAVVERDVGPTPLSVRFGPGLGFVSLVTIDGPPTDGFGDVDIGLGEESAWGFVTGVGGSLPLGDGWVLAPVADLLYQRAGGFHLLTVVLGGRLEFGF